MYQTAKKPTALPVMEYGRVAANHETGAACEYAVDTEKGRYRARKAKSCLLAPEPGDTVLLCTDDVGNCFILAVLEGDSPVNNLDFSGDVHLRVRRGNMNLAADKEINMTADGLGFVARQARATLERFSLLADAVSSQCRTIVLAADVCNQSLRSLAQRLGSYFRATEEHQEIQAGSARTLIEETHVVHCKNSVLMAEEDARIDADQIQLG